MARISKSAAATEATTTAAKGTKVGRVSKAAKSAQQAPAPKAKAKATESGQQARTGRRSQYTGMKIKNVSGSDAPCRGGAAIRFDTIVAHKLVDNAIGTEYTDTDGSTKAITSADIAYLIKRGLIEVA